MILVLLRAFANGGSSLTGVEAISNTVSAFRPPQGANARRVLRDHGLILGIPGRRGLLAGPRHPRDRRYVNGYPSVICAERARLRQRRDRPRLVLPGAGGDRADPVHRRQHQLQRLPVPGQLRRRGLVPAAPADETRPPAGVLQRHHRAHRAGGRPAGRSSARTSTRWCRSTRSACSPASRWPATA